MSHDPQPLGGKIISKPVMIFGPLIVICMLLIVKRLVFGLGSVSDLNGGFPWGVWIAFDLLIGTGFACGGWALAWAVYVFNRGQYHPLVVLRVAKLRNDSRMLFLSALSALLGCATWRLTYSLVAFNPGGGYAYFPTWEELLISIGFVAIEICAYIVLIRLLPILPPLKQNDHNRHEASKA